MFEAGVMIENAIKNMKQIFADDSSGNDYSVRRFYDR